jgi:hypothetical protein
VDQQQLETIWIDDDLVVGEPAETELTHRPPPQAPACSSMRMTKNSSSSLVS